MKGFKGKSANRFGSTVAGAYSKPLTTIQSPTGLDSTGVDWEKSIPKGIDRVISLDEEKMAYVTKEIQNIDEETTSEMFSIIQRIEELCEDQYYVPSAVPKIREMLSVLKKQLETSHELSVETATTGKQYIQAIAEADNSIGQGGKKNG